MSGEPDNTGHSIDTRHPCNRNMGPNDSSPSCSPAGKAQGESMNHPHSTGQATGPSGESRACYHRESWLRERRYPRLYGARLFHKLDMRQGRYFRSCTRLFPSFTLLNHRATRPLCSRGQVLGRPVLTVYIARSVPRGKTTRDSVSRKYHAIWQGTFASVSPQCRIRVVHFSGMCPLLRTVG